MYADLSVLRDDIEGRGSWPLTPAESSSDKTGPLPYPPNQGTKVASFGLIKALKPRFDVTVLRADHVPRGRAGGPRAREMVHAGRNRDGAQPEIACPPGRLQGVLPDQVGAYAPVAQGSVRLPGGLSPRGEDALSGTFRPGDHRILAAPPDDEVFPARPVRSSHARRRHVRELAGDPSRAVPPRKIDALRRWLVERREEVAAYRGMRRIWALTERDRDASKISAGESGRGRAPIGVDVSFFAPPGMQRNRGEVLFLGHLAASFNRDALVFFADEVYPRLKDVDGLSVTVVGGHLPKELGPFGLQPKWRSWVT